MAVVCIKGHCILQVDRPQTDDIWSRLSKSLGTTDQVINSIHLYEFRDHVKEMCHTQPVNHFRVHAMHMRQLEDLYKRSMKNKSMANQPQQQPPNSEQQA